jgi:Ca2+-binding RTX toxin-like protein
VSVGKGASVVYGGTGNDVLTGGGGNTLYGEEGNDILTADRSFSRDILIGGLSNDIYYTHNYASSTIVYHLGDGSDVISAKRPYLAQATYKDILRFGEGISFEDLRLEKQGNNLWIQVGVDINDTILIENFYATNLGTRTQIMQFEFADGSVIKREDDVLNIDVVGTHLDDVLLGTEFGEVVSGLAGNDKLTAEGGDSVYGGEGNDVLLSLGEGAPPYNYNTFVGGKGDDLFITDRYGRSKIYYEPGDGSDTIRRASNYRFDVTLDDVIVFGQGITFDNLTLTKQGNHLHIQVGEDKSDTLLIENFYDTRLYFRTRVTQLEFADGTIIKREDERLNPEIIGTNLDDVLIVGSDFADVFRGLEGNDRLMGNGGDTLYGDDGEDTLTSGGGSSVYQQQHNTLLGGRGDDLIITNRYSYSTIHYGIGDGADTIRRGSAYSRDSVMQDVILFGAGISFDKLMLNKQRNHLYVRVGDNDGDSLLIEDFYSTNRDLRTKVSQFEFADGTIIKREDERLNAEIIGTSLDDVLIVGSDFADVFRGLEGNDRLMGNGGDTLYGENGNDILVSSGNGVHNILIGGKGSDAYYTHNYASSIIFYALGDGADMIGSERNYGGVTTYYGRTPYEDILRFNDGISLENLQLEKQGNNLWMQVGDDNNDTILIENFYATGRDSRTKIMQFEFADGIVIKREDKRLNPDIVGSELADMLTDTSFGEKIFGPEGNDVINAIGGGDYIEVGDGDDSVNAGDGDNYVEAGAGNDTVSVGRGVGVVYGGTGNDVLIGGCGGNILYGEEGDDILVSSGLWYLGENTLIGGKGNDSYYTHLFAISTIVYNIGDGSDFIGSYRNYGGPALVYSGATYQGTLLFGDDISFEDLYLEKQGNSLWIEVGDNASDTIFIEDFYGTSRYSRTEIMQFKFADGTVIKRENMESVDNNYNHSYELSISESRFINTHLYGGNGEDTYRVDFAKTEKTVIDNHDSDGSSDYLKLEGVTTDDIRFYRNLNHLVIKNLANQNEPKQVVVQNWFKSADYQIDEIEAGDYGISNKQIAIIFQTLAAFNVDDGVCEDLLSKEEQDEIKNVLANAWMPKVSPLA